MYGCEVCPAFKTENADEFLRHAHEVHGYPGPTPPPLSFNALRVTDAKGRTAICTFKADGTGICTSARTELLEDSMSDLSFDALRAVNWTRCEKWHGPGTDPWDCADWSNAMSGENGELSEVALALIAARLALFVETSTGKAANTVKKIRRQETGAVNTGDPTMDKLKGDAAMELADVVIYADLLAKHLGIDLGEAVRTKFNKVSEKYEFPERL